MADAELEKIKGIGPKSAALLNEMGIFSADDLVRFYPAGYEVYEAPKLIRETVPGEMTAVRAIIDSAPQVNGFGKNAVVSVRLRDDSGTLRASWFHMPYIRSSLKKGEEAVFRGSVRESRYGRSLDQPQKFSPREYALRQGIIKARYLLPKGLSAARFSAAMREALAMADIPELLPADMAPKGSPGGREALEELHFPTSYERLEKARERLVLEEFTAYILQVRLLRDLSGARRNPCPMLKRSRTAEAARKLPYRLTGAQERALEEIEADLAGPRRMNRLLQGDVGSGKTAVALLAMLTAAENDYQAALMAPTEVLARQHYEKISAQLDSMGRPVRIGLLVGGQRAAERKEVLTGLKDGSLALAVGTHAMIQDGVTFHKLGLVITDEQHRFGVRQRGILAEKGAEPHVLVMSATPIPRTLAMILYGDLDISVLDELPAGRKPIQSFVGTPAHRASTYRLIEKELQAGHQAYVICPLVEESEGIAGENVKEMLLKLRQIFPKEFRIEALHGRMPPDEKARIMTDFAENRIQLLVSTTVVEVGVDVPNATVMLVENAERFGLAQLHQLRGRVGRSEAKSYAVFLDGTGGKKSSERLKILGESSDGFIIAEEDLRQRGPGDFFGIRQSGEVHFLLGDIYTDHEQLTEASRLANIILEEDPELRKEKYRALREYIKQKMPEGENL